jgi:anti-anti-sigma factor
MLDEQRTGNGDAMVSDELAHESTLRLSVSVLPGGRRVLVTARGEIDYGNIDQFGATLQRAVAHGSRQVVIDLRAVTFLGSEALQELALAKRGAEQAGGLLYVVGSAHCVVRPIEVIGLAGPLRLRAALADVPPP